MDTAVLRELLTHDGPFASVYYDSGHDSENAGKQLELRWRTMRDQLLDAGAPKHTVRALEDVVLAGAPPAGRAGRFLIATDSVVPIDEYLPDPPPLPMVRVSPLPYFLPLARSAPPSMPHVIVLVDKTGAALKAVGADGAVLAERTVEGSDHPVHKVRGAGWSHRSVQQHAEETVKHNIARVAEATAWLVRETSARLLVLAGDVEPESMLRKAIPPSCARIAAEIRTGRPTDAAGRDAFNAEVAERLTARWKAERDELLDRFAAALGREDGLAVQGLRPTTAALREANVATLVVCETDLGDRTVWTGSTPNLVAVDQAELHRIGASGRISSRADEALPAAAIAVGAGVVADGGQIRDGVGALLRHGE